MATRAVTDEMMQSIANAIRLKTGGASPMTVEQMPVQIGLIGGLPVGINAIDTGEIEQTADQTANITINHHLGVVPKVLILYDEDFDPSQTTFDAGNVLYSVAVNPDPSTSWTRAGFVGAGRASDGNYTSLASSTGYTIGFNRVMPTSTSVNFAVGVSGASGIGLKAGHTYRWIFIA